MGPHLPGLVTMVTTVCPARDQLVDPDCDVVMRVMCVCVCVYVSMRKRDKTKREYTVPH